MATTDARTSVASDTATGLVYDGFISYSHDANGLVAPRLQAALQRFAKPWWKRRALRIFRDESSLSASPHLWDSITSALDNSNWFILLLSPEAAHSRWVNQEVEYWLENKNADQIIPVVTDGEFRWADGDITAATTAAPPALYGAFQGDPRWVDLRFAETEEQLHLKNPQFSAAVADIASAVRGVPKEDLESEEVRQHRRTVRTAWTAGAVVLVLAVLAGAAALFALDQRNEAVANAAQAEALAEAEAVARQDAEAATARETVARLEAERSTLLATSNELALRAEKEIPIDPELGMLLAIEAIELARQAGEEPTQATRSLRTTLASSRILHRIEGGGDEQLFVALSTDGSLLATNVGDSAGVWDTTSWEQIATFTEPGGAASAASFDPSGERLAVAYGFISEDTIPSPVVVYDLNGGPSVSMGDGLHPFPGVEFALGGEVVVAKTFDFESGSGGFGKWSATTGEFLGPLGDGLGNFDVDPAGDRVATIPGDRFRIHDIATGAVLIDDLDGFGYVSVAFSPSGTRVAEVSQDLRRLRIRDAATGAVLLDEEIARLAGVAWLDESRVAVGGGGVIRVVDTETGRVLYELAGHLDAAWELAALPGTDRLASASFDGAVLIWDASTSGVPELPSIDVGLPDAGFIWSGPDGSIVLRRDTETGVAMSALLADGSTVLLIDGLTQFATPSQDGSHSAFIRADGRSGVISVPAGEIIYEAPPGLEVLGVNSDASMVVLAEPFDFPTWFEQVPVVVATATGEVVGELNAPRDDHYNISPDSSLVSHSCCGAPNSSVYLLPGGEATGDVFGFGSFFSPSGALLANPSGQDGRVLLIDTQRLEETKSIESSIAAVIAAHGGSPFGAFSPDGSMLVTSTFDEPIRVWDIAGVLDGVEPRLVAEIDANLRAGPPSTMFSADGRHIIALSTDGVLLRFTLDTDELIVIARTRLTRGLAPEECSTFGIDRCAP